MGKQTKRKQDEAFEHEDKFKNVFAFHSKKVKDTSSAYVEKPLTAAFSEKHIQSAINDPEMFKCSLKGNNRNRKILLLAKHMFAQYKIPKILEKVWDEKEGRMVIDESRFAEMTKGWFISAGNGESLYKVHLKSFFTKKEGHIFVNCPFDISIKEALVYAVALAESGDVGISLRIAQSKMKDRDIKTEFNRQIIRFFAQKDKTPNSINEINDLIDYIVHEKSESPNFNLFGNGWTLQSLTKRMVDWHYALRRKKAMGNYEWEGHAVDGYTDTYIGPNQEIHEWSIHQIKNSKELHEEGTKQHHCVSSYRHSCVNGNVSIWSLRLDGKRKVTIELKNSGAIVQARGYANRKTTGQEDSIIQKWAKLNNLYCSYKY
jgi:hypothetical protein